MDPSITSGANMTVVGVTTVFLALSLLLGVVTLMARIVGATSPEAQAAAGASALTSTHSSTSQNAGAGSDEHADLEKVAIAAYALHQARRVSVRGPVPASPWLRAGRQSQVDRGSRS